MDHHHLVFILILIILLSTFYQLNASSSSSSSSYTYSSSDHDDPNGLDMDGLSTAQIVELRKFKAREHHLITTDGYNLTLVEITNPLYENVTRFEEKDPILFIHGIRRNARDFISNSINVRPRAYALEHDLSKLSMEQLITIMADDPAKESLVFTLLQFNYKIILLNRRGSIESRGHKTFTSSNETDDDYYKSLIIKNSTTNTAASKQLITGNYLFDMVNFIELPPVILFWNPIMNAGYWNYSLDEQCKFDLPETIEFVLTKLTTRKKLSIVAHSAGGAITLMAMSQRPDLESKLNKVMLWAPAIHLGGPEPPANSTILLFGAYTFSRYSHASPFTALIPMEKRAFNTFCYTKIGQDRICQAADSDSYGSSYGQLNMKPGVVTAPIDIVSSHEYAQLIRSNLDGRTRQFNYENPMINKMAYGSELPPIYDLSKIKHNNISIWWGNTDTSVEPKAIEHALKELNVTVEQHFINNTGILFNHVAFMLHKNCSTLITFPAAMSLASN